MDTSHIDKSQPPFILVDGSYYLFRTYHALPNMRTSQGLHTNAVRGILNSINKLMRRYQPTHMAVAFDTKSPTFRHEMSTDYKANRKEMEAELAEQIPYVHQLIKALGIPLIAIEGAEADDVIGTLAYRACLEGHHVVISTGDKDMAQLVNDCVILEDSFKGQITDVTGVKEKFEVEPKQIIDYLTLMGDSSDGIKGVPKVGKKTAVKLLNEYQTLENILANAPNIKGVVGKNLLAYAKDTERDKQLATIVTSLDALGELGLDWSNLLVNTDPIAHIDELRQLYTELEFKNELSSLNHPNHPSNLGANFIDENQFNSETQAQIHKAKSAQNTSVTTKTDDKQWHTILKQTDFDNLIQRLEQAEYFAIDTETTSINWRQAELVGISIALQSHEAYYIPLTHGLQELEQLGGLDFGDNEENSDPLIKQQLKREQVLAKFKPILENQKIGKIGQHLKYDAHIFANYDIQLTNWHCDTMLASYVLNASATKHNMDS
ncbi:MAG: DNA polymerase I, partial [Moraxellaceae bacterium]|nr:DNA polymerase I [Moraxellaceae bacterium]